MQFAARQDVGVFEVYAIQRLAVEGDLSDIRMGIVEGRGGDGEAAAIVQVDRLLFPYTTLFRSWKSVV